MSRIENTEGGHSKSNVWRRWLTATALALGFLTASQATASAETRTLKLYYTHTGEKAEITFKRNGRYDAAGLKKLNQFLRDWRRNEPTRMDPRLFDVVWEAYRKVGASDYIHVVSAYRSPATNSMLRSRSSGVAEKSQHMLGKAMDFFIPGVPLKKLRDAGLRIEAGGVGYYPRSGSPFVHMDVGNVRHWPRMSRQELVSVFPNGKTMHVPSDGKPLPGFEQAVASYQARKQSGEVVLASASPSPQKRGLFATLFGGGADEEEDVGESVVAAASPSKPRAPAPTVAALPAAKPQSPIMVVAPENAQRVEIPQVADQAPAAGETPETILAALPARSVPLPGVAPRPQAEVVMAAAENIPFGAASAPLDEGVPASPAEQQVAANVPLPTWRPNYSTPAELKPANDAVLMALASADDAPALATAPLPSARPQDMTVEAALAAANDIPADDDEEAGQGGLEVAALAPQPEPLSVFNAPDTAPAPTPKTAVAALSTGSDPASAAAGGAKTTRKAGRPLAQEAKPEPKPVVVAAAPDAARWALRSGEQLTMVTTNTKAPGFAYNMVRTAPTEVYTTGFQQGNQMADANRFSGSAVKFLSVARFATN